MKLMNHWYSAVGLLGVSILMLKLTSVAHAAALETQTQPSQAPQKDALIRIMEQSIPESIPGAIVFAVHHGEVVLEAAQGYANLELQVPMQTNFSFQIGSVAKQFTAVAVLQLVEQGKLSLSTPAAEFLPETCSLPDTITVEHLLTHSSGIPNYLGLAAWREQARLPASLNDVHKLYCNLSPHFPAGAAWDYSNSGYFLLADIVAQVSGQSFHQYLQEHLLNQAGVTEIWPHESHVIYPGFVNGYIEHGAGHRPSDFYDPSQVLGAGSLIGTMRGLYQWHQSVLNNELLQPDTLAKAWTPFVTVSGRPTDYGYGWEMKQIQGFDTVEHGGYFPGYFTSVVSIPDESLFVAAFVNARGYDPIDLTTRLAAAILGQPYPEPDYVAVSDDLVSKWQGTWRDTDNVERRIGLRNGELYIQRGQGSAFQLLPDAQGKLHYTDSVSYLALETNANGTTEMVLYNRAGMQSRSERVNNDAFHYQHVELSATQKTALTGYYQIAPEFGFRLFIDQGDLYLQGTGQNAGRLMVLGPLHLISEDLIAEFKFTTDDNGAIDTMVIYQGSQRIPATKVN